MSTVSGVIMPPPPEERRSLFEAAACEARAHRWIESEKAHRDLGDQAILDWYKRYWRIFCRERFIQHLMGERFWTELDADDFAMLRYRFVEDDPLINDIIKIFCRGGENLDVINYAIDTGADIEQVLARLQVIDINARRLAPSVAITEKQFVDNIHAKHRPRGMVVDPDPKIGETLRKHIEGGQMECLIAVSGEKAMEEAQARQFDVFFIELSLPGKQGAEVAWFLRRHGVTAPVAAMSGNLADWSEDDLNDCGFSDVLGKPLAEDAVNAVLSRIKHDD